MAHYLFLVDVEEHGGANCFARHTNNHKIAEWVGIRRPRMWVIPDVNSDDCSLAKRLYIGTDKGMI